MNIFGDLKDLTTPWRFSLNDWKDKVKTSEIGSPIHGLRAGYEATKLGSAYRAKQGIDRINDGQNPLSGEFIQGLAHDQGHNVQNFWKQNYPVILSAVGGAGYDAAGGLGEAFSGGSALGAGEGGISGGLLGGAGAGSALNLGAGLLGGGEQQQAPQIIANQPVDIQKAQRARMVLERENALQQLRQKPNKTLEDLQQIAMFNKQQGLLGDMSAY